MGDKSRNGANKVRIDNVLEKTSHIEHAATFRAISFEASVYICVYLCTFVYMFVYLCIFVNICLCIIVNIEHILNIKPSARFLL